MKGLITRGLITKGIFVRQRCPLYICVITPFVIELLKGSICAKFILFYMNNLLNNKWIIFCLITAGVFIVFGRAIWFDYVQLDEGVLLINNNFFISQISNLFEVFKHDINYPSAASPYYRPIFVLSFMINSQISSSPNIYHLGNLLLHSFAAFSVFILLLELGVKRNISVVFAGLFAVHPAVTPIVAWVPGRIEAILTIFTILSLVMFIRFLNSSNWRYLIGFLVFFTTALFTKEVVLASLPILLLYYLMNKDKKDGETLITLFSGLAAIITAWFFIRKNILSNQIEDLSVLEMLKVFVSNSSAYILYLGKTILPFNLTVLPVFESFDLIYGLIVLAILFFLLFIGRSRFLKWGLLGLIWFFSFLAPSLVSYNLPEKMIFFEHRLYLPIVGIFIFLAGFLQVLSIKLRKIWPIVAGVAVLFLILAYNYSGSYKNKTEFWQKAVADSPRLAEAHNGLATVYLTDGKIPEAMAEFSNTLDLNPKTRRAHLLLGLYYLDKEKYEEAKSEFEKEIETDPKQFIAYHNLGRIYAQRKNMKEAEANLLKAVELSSNYVLARQDLVVLYFSQNKHKEALTHLKELLKIQRPEAMHPQILEILEIYGKEAALQLQPDF